MDRGRLSFLKKDRESTSQIDCGKKALILNQPAGKGYEGESAYSPFRQHAAGQPGALAYRLAVGRALYKSRPATGSLKCAPPM